jgi:hypothetical protein
MFGNNTQDYSQTSNPVANDYDSQLPVGGEDLIASGQQQQTQQSQQQQPQNQTYGQDNTQQVGDNSSYGQVDQQQPMQPTQTDNLQGVTNDDLANIKQNALQELKPLVTHLDQTPEEKFRTTMMMIQASDDKSLLQSAYSQAQEITDEKARAQALLDVVNEINYFSQNETE